jgi:protein-disulfide isomerase
MNNNIVAIILVLIVGVGSGMGLLFGIGNAVSVSTKPLYERIEQVSDQQKAIDKKLDGIIESLKNVRAPQAAQGQQRPQEDLNKVYNIPVGESVIIGKKDAPVTIVKFTDLQCPFCSRFYPPLKEALKAYPDQVRVILKNYPLAFHPNAKPAAKLTLAAREQGKYIEMVEALLGNGAKVTEEDIKSYAQKLGLNYDKLVADLKANDAAYEKQINEEAALGDQVDVRGTPTFFINGKKTQARDFNGFKSEIDKILAQK